MTQASKSKKNLTMERLLSTIDELDGIEDRIEELEREREDCCVESPNGEVVLKETVGAMLSEQQVFLEEVSSPTTGAKRMLSDLQICAGLSIYYNIDMIYFTDIDSIADKNPVFWHAGLAGGHCSLQVIQ